MLSEGDTYSKYRNNSAITSGKTGIAIQAFVKKNAHAFSGMVSSFEKTQKCLNFVRYLTNDMKKEEVLTEDQKSLARFAKAMGHPIRMYVLELLSKQSCCYSGDLSEELPIAKSTLSQHLKELKDVGLIQGET